MKDVIDMIENFKIKRFCNTVFGWNPHDAIIGEWIRWWLVDSKLGERRKRRVINSAIAIRFGGKTVISDLLFAEQARINSDLYKILGVAEVENSQKGFLRKLKNLSLYEESGKKEEERKFPDLKFALLCIKVSVSKDSTFRNIDLIKELNSKMQEFSKNSGMYWILYMLKFTWIEEDSPFRVRNYVRGYDEFWYSYSFYGSDFYVYYGGEIRKRATTYGVREIGRQ